MYLNLLSRERKTGHDPLDLHVVIVLCGVIFFQRRNLQSTTHDACSDRASTEWCTEAQDYSHSLFSLSSSGAFFCSVIVLNSHDDELSHRQSIPCEGRGGWRRNNCPAAYLARGRGKSAHSTAMDSSTLPSRRQTYVIHMTAVWAFIRLFSDSVVEIYQVCKLWQYGDTFQYHKVTNVSGLVVYTFLSSEPT